MLPTNIQLIWPSGFRGEDYLRNRPIRNNNCLWQPCLLTDRDEMNKLYRKPSIDASYQFIWPSGFRGEDFYLDIDQSETRIACGGHVCNRIRTK